MTLASKGTSVKQSLPSIPETSASFGVEVNAQTTLVIIDSGVEDYSILAAGVLPNIKTVILDPHQDGVAQITKALQAHPHTTSLHIVSHGSPGCLYLGNTQLSLETLDRHSWDLQSWFASLAFNRQPSLLLYGCNIAAGDSGEEFLTKLHHLTHANIAASDHKVGHTSLDGTWDLNIFRGVVTSNLAFQPKTLDYYNSVFNTAPVFGSTNGLIYRTSIDGNGSFEVYNPQTNIWSGRAPVNTRTQLATDGSGNLYILNATTNKIQRYNATNDTWTDVINGPPAGISYGNLEVTNSGEFVVTQLDSSTLYYTSGGNWNTYVLPSSASALGDYEHKPRLG